MVSEIGSTLRRATIMRLRPVFGAVMFIGLAGCLSRDAISPNSAGYEHARVAIAGIRTSEERRGCYARALAGDSPALYDALFDPHQRDPGYNTAAEPPIFLAPIFLEAMGDNRFSEAVGSWSEDSRFQVAMYIMKEGAGVLPTAEVFRDYPRTARILNLDVIKRRL